MWPMSCDREMVLGGWRCCGPALTLACCLAVAALPHGREEDERQQDKDTGSYHPYAGPFLPTGALAGDGGTEGLYLTRDAPIDGSRGSLSLKGLLELRRWILSSINSPGPITYSIKHDKLGGGDDNKAYGAASQLSKRQGFSAWAGKRSPPSTDSSLILNLRSFLQDKLFHRDLGNKRQQFSAWAGKRSDSDAAPTGGDGDAGNDLRRTTSDVLTEEAAELQKRANNGLDTNGLPSLEKILSTIRDASVDRRAFSAWSGKRGFSAWAGKRASN